MIIGAVLIALYMAYYAGQHKKASEIYQKQSQQFMESMIADLVRYQIDYQLSNVEAVGQNTLPKPLDDAQIGEF